MICPEDIGCQQEQNVSLGGIHVIKVPDLAGRRAQITGAAQSALKESQETHVQSERCIRACTSRPKAAEKSLAMESTVMSWATISMACM